jgi:hypothetical protein
MSEVGMTQEITGLVDSSVASGSHQGQAVGFVAAALTGTAAVWLARQREEGRVMLIWGSTCAK